MDNIQQAQLTGEELEAVSGGAARTTGGKVVTIRCGKCGKLLRVTYGMNARCPDQNCKWVTVFSPDNIVTG